jgi:hypothetical protein
MRLLWLPHRVAFFLTLETHVVISSVSSPSDTTRSLCTDDHSCFDNNTRSLSSEGHSLDLCAQMSPPPDPVHRHQLRVLWGSHLISVLRKSALQQAGRPRVRACTMAKGARADVDRAVLRTVIVVAMPPPILLLGCACLVESPRQGGN